LISPEQIQAELLDEYLSALQSGNAARCQALLDEHPELRSYANCLINLHDLTAESQTLPPQPRPSPSTSGLLVGTQFGKYHLEAELGRGGMGIVYQARQLDLHRKVALKMILHGPLASPEEVARFLKEARAVANLQHPHIVQVYEVGEHAGQHYLAMEYLDGTSLERILCDQKTQGMLLAPDEAVRFLLPLVQAVHFLHQHGVIHRDLKPHNIMVGAFAEVQVMADWAYLRNYLQVSVSPPNGGPLVHRSGYTLTIFRKQSDGRWLLARDANLMTLDN